jgi:hypothetical protein
MSRVGRQDERRRDLCQRLVLATVFVANRHDHWLLLRW